MRLVRYKSNRFLKHIHENKVIFYFHDKEVYLIDDGVYVLKGLLNFKYCLKNGRKIIFVYSSYFNYILKKLRENSVSYVGIKVYYGYNKIFEYSSLDNNYKFYYSKGKRMIKNEKRIKKLIDYLEKYGTIDVVNEMIGVVCHD